MKGPTIRIQFKCLVVIVTEDANEHEVKYAESNQVDLPRISVFAGLRSRRTVLVERL